MSAEEADMDLSSTEGISPEAAADVLVVRDGDHMPELECGGRPEDQTRHPSLFLRVEHEGGDLTEPRCVAQS